MWLVQNYEQFGENKQISILVMELQKTMWIYNTDCIGTGYNEAVIILIFWLCLMMESLFGERQEKPSDYPFTLLTHSPLPSTSEPQLILKLVYLNIWKYPQHYYCDSAINGLPTYNGLSMSDLV